MNLVETSPGIFESDGFVFFWGGPFSNWHKGEFEFEGVVFNCAEQAMMYHKAKLFGDESAMRKIMFFKNPKDQKAVGRSVFGYDDEVWDFERYQIVCRILYAKFTQHPELAKLLHSTGTKTIVEASPYDTIWGIGLGISDADIHCQLKWKGQNLLGKALMEIRRRWYDHII